MRTVFGEVVLPPDAPAVRAGRVVVELRDVSRLDAPSRVVAEQRLEDVPLRPNGRIGFRLDAPDVPAADALSVRVHVDMAGDGRVAGGDLLSTTANPVPPTGGHGPIVVAVRRV